MAWAKPEHSRSKVNSAGDLFVRSDDIGDILDALTIINNWRASHQYPLNTFQMTLRRKARKISAGSLVAQRIKRMESISRKLQSGTMKLVQMQDIGGCRAILPTTDDVYRLREFYAKAEFDHKLRNEKDYIRFPKDDGYRSIHLIYEYKATGLNFAYDGLKIEIQMRTQLQHAWATAVEAVGTFTKQALKWRGGDAEWQRFFLLMSGAVALREGRPVPPGVADRIEDLAIEIRALSSRLRVNEALRAYNVTLNYSGSLEERKARLLLVHMKPDEEVVEIKGYRVNEASRASDDYAKIEKEIRAENSDQAVLVRIESIRALRRAYPNLFLDTAMFAEFLEEVCQH